MFGNLGGKISNLFGGIDVTPGFNVAKSDKGLPFPAASGTRNLIGSGGGGPTGGFDQAGGGLRNQFVNSLQQTVAGGGGQPAAPQQRPQQVSSGGGGGGFAGGGGTRGGSGGGGQAAQAGPNAGNLRKDIKNRLDTANRVFEALVGDIDDIIADRRQQVESQFGEQQDQLVDQFNQEIPALSRSFTARGLADSSFRNEAVRNAGTQFDQLLGDVGQEQEQALGQLGEFGATQKANITADRGSIGDVLSRLPQITDGNQLLQELDNAAQLVRELQARRSGLQTNDQFVQGLNQVTGGSTGLPALRQRLSQLAQGLAPRPLKEQVARGLVSNSGLDPNQARGLLSEFQGLLSSPDDEEDEQVV